MFLVTKIGTESPTELDEKYAIKCARAWEPAVMLGISKTTDAILREESSVESCYTSPFRFIVGHKLALQCLIIQKICVAFLRIRH